MIIILFWLILCVVVAAVASGRGHSGILFFFVSLILSPLIGLILSLVIPSSKKGAVGASNQISAMDELKKLKELADQGVISQEEFEKKKAQLL